MKWFQFWYSETDTYRAVFSAESLEQAREMLNKAFNEDGYFSDLPGFDAVGKGYDAEWSEDSLIEISREEENNG